MDAVKVAILISGRGSNMQSLVKQARKTDLPLEVSLVLSNRPDAAGIDWANKQDIPTHIIDHTAYPDRQSFEQQLHAALAANQIDLICLAGFMRILSADFITKWEDRILNIHPSLLPSFKGLNTHARALDAGVKLTGCSVHVVNQDLDAGAILTQAAVPILPTDTEQALAERVLKQEHFIYPAILEEIAFLHQKNPRLEIPEIITKIKADGLSNRNIATADDHLVA